LQKRKVIPAATVDQPETKPGSTFLIIKLDENQIIQLVVEIIPPTLHDKIKTLLFELLKIQNF